MSNEPPTECPVCNGSLAHGGANLSCIDCDWSASIEQIARWSGMVARNPGDD